MSDIFGGILGIAVIAFIMYARENPKLTVGQFVRETIPRWFSNVATGTGVVLSLLFGLAMTVLGWYCIVWFVHWAWRHS